MTDDRDMPKRVGIWAKGHGRCHLGGAWVVLSRLYNMMKIKVKISKKGEWRLVWGLLY